MTSVSNMSGPLASWWPTADHGQAAKGLGVNGQADNRHAEAFAAHVGPSISSWTPEGAPFSRAARPAGFAGTDATRHARIRRSTSPAGDTAPVDRVLRIPTIRLTIAEMQDPAVVARQPENVQLFLKAYAMIIGLTEKWKKDDPEFFRATTEEFKAYSRSEKFMDAVVAEAKRTGIYEMLRESLVSRYGGQEAMARAILRREHALCPPQQAGCSTLDEAWALEQLKGEYDWDEAFAQLSGTSGYIDSVVNEQTEARYQADEQNTGTLALSRIKVGHATDDDYRIEIESGESGGLIYKVTNTTTGAVSEPKPFESGAWVQFDEHQVQFEGSPAPGDKFNVIVDHHPAREERVWVEDLAPVRMKAKADLFMELFDPYLENDVDATPVWELVATPPQEGTSMESASVAEARQSTNAA